MFRLGLQILFLLSSVNVWADLTEERRKEINDGIAGLLTKLDKTKPGITMSQDMRPFAATLIAVKWIQYLKPGPEYFSENTKTEGYRYEEMQTQLEEALKTMESANPTVVDNYSNTVIVYANAADRLRRNNQYDHAIMEAVEEMLLQSYIARKKLSVTPGETIEIKADMFLKLKNPGLSDREIESKLTRTFKVPPLDTLTILENV